MKVATSQEMGTWGKGQESTHVLCLVASRTFVRGF